MKHNRTSCLNRLDIIPNIRYLQVCSINPCKYKPGFVITSYLKEKLKTSIPQEFQSICNDLDETRKLIISQPRIEAKDRFANYVILITALTKDFDTSANGIDLQFQYEAFVKSDINYDICLLGFYVVLNLLKYASETPFNKDDNVILNIKTINSAKEILKKVNEVFRDDFFPLEKSHILTLEKHIDACWAHSSVCCSITKNLSLESCSKHANSCSIMYSQIDLNRQIDLNYFKDLIKFFAVFSLLIRFEQSFNEKKYGNAIAYGKYIINNYIYLSSKKKKNKPKRANLPEILSDLLKESNFEVILATIENDNKNIYNEIVPSQIEFQSVSDFKYPGKYDWKGTLGEDLLTLKNSTLKLLVDKADKKIVVIKDNIRKLANDLAKSILLYPYKKANFIEETNKELERLTGKTSDWIELVSGLNSSNPKIGVIQNIERFVMLNNMYKENTRRNMLKFYKAYKLGKDLRTEGNNIFKYWEMMETEKEKSQNIMDIVNKMNEQGSNLSLKEIFQKNGMIEAQINDIETKVASISADGTKRSSLMSEIAGKCLEHLNTEFSIVKRGLKECLKNYQELINRIEEVREIVDLTSQI